MKFFKCDDCEQIALVLTQGKDCKGVGKELVANTTDAATEKHVPFLTWDNNELQVQVGEVEHPMIDAHYIEWIVVVTKTGGLLERLKPGVKPYANFKVAKEDVVAVYEYCNLHGLWKIEL